MDKDKLRQLLDFASDETRVNAAFDKVIDGIESGAITAEDFPFPAGPIGAGQPAPVSRQTLVLTPLLLEELAQYRKAHAEFLSDPGKMGALHQASLNLATALNSDIEAQLPELSATL
ncbi:hypothetical protein ACIPL1_27815 [Pseudomonas sp. NPDC090202]|uniref:hypothetical protein n=1 Tax=Pseudomonas sp. NPDC090202 TaxID=3364476 RepID=UPI0038267F01